MIRHLRNILGIHIIGRNIGREQAPAPLPFYRNSTSDALSTTLLIAVAIIYTLVSGYFLGVFQQYILLQFTLPIIALLSIILWAIPDKQNLSITGMQRVFLLYVISSVIWPNYLAFSLPGLPWIGLGRLCLFLASAFFFVILSMDQETRSNIGTALKAHKPIRIFFLLFIAVQIFVLVFANEVGDAFSALFNNQMNWTIPFLLGLAVFWRFRNLELFIKALLVCGAVLSLIAVREAELQRLPWVGRIPSFLAIDNPILIPILTGAKRAADGIYRVQTTYTTSLSCAEFMAMITPFILYYMFSTRNLIYRILLVALYFGALYTIIVTGSRLGMIGFAIAHLVYPALVGIRRWARLKNDLVGPSLIALYPAMLGVFMAALLASRRLYVMFLGGGQHQASNDAREAMYSKGIPLIFQNPWGFGVNQGGNALGFRNQAGVLTIDSYYLTIGLDYGVLGFIAFYGMILTAIYIAVRTYFLSSAPEAKLSAPIGITLGSYLVIKSVLSQSQNQHILFMLIAATLVLSYHYAPAFNSKRRAMPAAQPQAA